MKRWMMALGLVVMAGAGWWEWHPGASREPLALSLYFTGDVRGRLVPCGCFTGQMGGLTRIATLLGQEQNPNTLKVDVGDALEGTEDFQRIQYRYILEAFGAMGYAAANLGHREAALSVLQLRELQARSPVPLLSANLLEKSSGAPVLLTHRIVRRGPWRIALVGVMDSHIAAESLGEGLVVEPMQTTLARLLPTLKSQADMIVLLAFADEAALSSLAHDFYELDLILGGKVSQPSQSLVRENRSLVFATTNQSRALGRLELRLAAGSKVTAKEGSILLVRPEIGPDAQIETLAAKYRAEVRETKLSVDDPARLQADRVQGIRSAATFVGSASCLECHPSAAKVWSASSHARAFATLVDRNADADPNCIKCHSVGFGAPGGYLREMKRSKLTDVGCESCHGPGSVHLAQRKNGGAPGPKLRAVGAGDCQKCHHGEFSRPFLWDQFWPLIEHSKG
jgi:nitrate/TMAO reductase-like tetraheme cytochrome c subunit